MLGLLVGGAGIAAVAAVLALLAARLIGFGRPPAGDVGRRGPDRRDQLDRSP